MPNKLTIVGDQPTEDRQTKKRQTRQAKRQLASLLTELTEGWGNMTANQQRDAMRQAIVLLARIATQ